MGLGAIDWAILGLYLSARRRRYEYAALAATGVKRRTLRNAVLIELTIVLGFGAIVGLGTGLAGAANPEGCTGSRPAARYT